MGVCLRILIAVNLMGIIAAVLQTSTLQQAFSRLAELSITIQPVLLASLLLFYAAYPLLRKLPYAWAVACIIGTVLLLTSIIHQMDIYGFGAEPPASLIRSWLFGLCMTLTILGYFNLRQRALSPAITEARLQALQARIRPHFLFNCINAVLSIMRSEPKRAETALEDMADLFRVVMSDNRELVPLAQELALSRQYLALEKLRLDERLEIVWQIENVPPDALIPPLVLQPLLENAVYHGIEPLPQGGRITIQIEAGHKEVRLRLSNPCTTQSNHHGGNKMALNNIRERLALHFDAEATLSSQTGQGQYHVEIVIPYREHMA